MATSADFIEFVCEQVAGAGVVRHRKMFGEYMVYVDDKPVLLVCDNTVYIKKFEELTNLMFDAPTGKPYKGAKEHYLLDIENISLLNEVLPILCTLTPISKKKTKK